MSKDHGKTICLIPARGGSKRLVGKNKRPLAGKPLIAHSIEAALATGVFHQVVVSSDDPEILEIGRAYGALAEERKPELAGDTITFTQVVADFILGRQKAGGIDSIACLLPTCPLRASQDLAGAHELFLRLGRRVMVIGVTQYDFPPQLAMYCSPDDNALSLREPESYGSTTRSQGHQACFHPNGAIYLSDAARFLETKTFFAPPMAGYPMPAERSMDIDTAEQFAMVEAMLAAGKGGKP